MLTLITWLRWCQPFLSTVKLVCSTLKSINNLWRDILRLCILFLIKLSPTCFSIHWWFCSILFRSKYFKISLDISSLTYALFISVLLNLQVFWDFPAIILLLISSLIPLWSESRHCIISVLLNSSRCVLWPRMWSILVNVPCELEKNIYYATSGMKYSICQLYPVDWWHCWIELCPYWFFHLLDLPISGRGCWSLSLW